MGHFLVLSVNLKSIFQSSSEIVEVGRFRGRVELVAYKVQSMVWVFFYQPTCRKLACWLAGEEEEDGRRGQGLCPDMEGLESGVSCWVGGHSLLDPLCEFAAYVSETL